MGTVVTSTSSEHFEELCEVVEDIMGDNPGDYELLFEEVEGQGDARLLFANFTSGLVAVNSTLLLLAALALGGLAALAYLFYTLSQNQSSTGGSYGSYGGSSQTYGSSYASDSYGRYRRDSDDTEWIRILTLLDVGSDLYTNMTQKNLEESCPAKIMCQAFGSSDIFGLLCF
eukprot:TRINITY_DN28096_c0_g1_i1.p1 TRINITY_DN28096_c0_g1~~TRINITY_DN28096_c0_g1_i1.p1  ORF type:complete len:172 (+),score=43.69 TRINITY_DN28096_c0_g1_i1:94-609(+)